jgi:hypothetical protein
VAPAQVSVTDLRSQMRMSGNACEAALANQASRNAPSPRRNKQHTAIVLGLGGLFPDPETVQAILAPEDGEKKRILDLGWCFAHVEKIWLI